jgi:hypothetical protein
MGHSWMRTGRTNSLNLGGDFNLGKKYLIDPIRALPDVNQRGHLFVLISA